MKNVSRQIGISVATLYGEKQHRRLLKKYRGRNTKCEKMRRNLNFMAGLLVLAIFCSYNYSIRIYVSRFISNKISSKSSGICLYYIYWFYSLSNARGMEAKRKYDDG
ncbi:hypothetical protein J2Z52_003316 [Enterococcus rivorum]|uniref:Uncharacterized protein n=1 Tax=Enterococcus rivorum TaxID=762845 RepID=A0A1E5KWF7_9ENTE|nr:hypothetical protein [Enterococcus rivorum]OEH82148.1 hypothetical protein BCR26_14200 [Enterococcus rivorum]